MGGAGLATPTSSTASARNCVFCMRSLCDPMSSGSVKQSAEAGVMSVMTSTDSAALECFTSSDWKHCVDTMVNTHRHSVRSAPPHSGWPSNSFLAHLVSAV